MKSMAECVLQITQEIKEIKKTITTPPQGSQNEFSMRQNERHNERMEKRFQDVSFDIPTLNKNQK